MRAYVLAMFALGLCANARAVPIIVDFNLTQTAPFAGFPGGPLAGFWSFDDSLIAPGALFEDVNAGMPLDTFSFSWLGQHWNPTNARLARLEFDQSGALRSWLIGGIGVSGGCAAVGVLDCVGIPTTVADFVLGATRLEPGIPPPEVSATAVLPGVDAFASAEGTFSIRSTTVPEPRGLGVLAAAALLMLLRGRQPHYGLFLRLTRSIRSSSSIRRSSSPSQRRCASASPSNRAAAQRLRRRSSIPRAIS